MARKKILIVEDEILISLNMENLLRNYGYDPIPSIQTAEEAVELIDTVTPDLILMDIILAGPMDGIEAARLIRKKSDVPIIYLTANADPATVKRARETRPYGYLNKPVSERDLYTNIDTAMNINQIEQKLRRSESRLSRINEVLLSLGPDSAQNIQLLISLIGEIFDADMAAYMVPEGRFFRIEASWKCPAGEENEEISEGHVCHDVFSAGAKEPVIVEDLQSSRYFHSDPMVQRYGLKSYLGQTVFCGGAPAGVIGIMFRKESTLAPEDIKLIGIISSAVGTEAERLATSIALRSSEERYRLVSELTTDYVFRLAIRTTGEISMDFISENYTHITGRRPDEALTPEKWTQFISPADHGLLMQALASALSTGEAGDLVTRSMTADGSERWIRIYYRPVRDESGAVAWILGAVKDISQQVLTDRALSEKSRELEEANGRLKGTVEKLEAMNTAFETANENLREANESLAVREKWLESIFRAAPMGIGFVRDRFLRDANRKLFDICGYSPDEIIGKSADMLYPSAEEFARVTTQIRDQYRSRGKGSIRTRWKRKDGSEIDVLINSTPVDLGDWSKGFTFTVVEAGD